jgi:hypothetical protein
MICSFVSKFLASVRLSVTKVLGHDYRYRVVAVPTHKRDRNV